MSDPPAGASVFVDLSNVCKDAGLGVGDHAAWHRWERLRAEWLRQKGRATFLLIADASLLSALNRADQARLRAMADAGQALVVDDADTEVLRRAVSHRGTALSNDRYVDHRRLQGLQDAQLVGWVARADGVRFRERSLARLLSVVVSRRAEKQALKDLGLREDSPELLRKWHCRDAGCGRDVVATPAMVKGIPTCGDCGGYLEAGQPWRQALWLKVMHSTTEIGRAVLEDGDLLVIGNGSDPETLPLATSPDADVDLAKLSARHAEFSNVSGHLYVRDLGSERGSAVRLPAAGERNMLLPPAPLSSQGRVAVPPGAKVVLGRTRVTCQVSGSRGMS